MAATDVATYGILADAVRPRYGAISALPSRQQFLYFVALCVRANGADPTQHSSLFPSSPNAAPRSPLMRQSCRVMVMLLLSVGLCTARPAPRGGLSTPPGRLSVAQLAPGGDHTMPPSSLRVCGRCRLSQTPSKSPLARAGPAVGPVMLAWR